MQWPTGKNLKLELVPTSITTETGNRIRPGNPFTSFEIRKRGDRIEQSLKVLAKNTGATMTQSSYNVMENISSN